MTDAVTFTVPGDPVGKGRPRVGQIRTPGGLRPNLRTPEKTAKYERKVARYARAALGDEIFPHVAMPIEVRVLAWFKCPSRDVRKRNPAPERPHTKTPDLDNVVKSALDALNGVLFNDDAQVVNLTASKRIAAQGAPGNLVVTVRPYHERSLLDAPEN